MNISIIIPCKNEAGVVDTLLDCLVNQTRPPDEVIVVNSHSSDATVTHVKQFSKKLPLKVINAKKRGVAHARNEGASASRGSHYVFIDADATVPTDFLANIEAGIDRDSLDIAAFSQRMASRKIGLRFGARMMNGYVRLMSYTPWPIFFSCYYASKETHQKINGFDPDIWIMEDYDYALRAKRAGATFGVLPTVHFHSSPRRYEQETFKDVVRGVYAELYRYTHGLRITKPLFTYDMGGEKEVIPKR